MKKFGYLPSGAPNSEALHTEESITDAVKQMQMFGGLHPSGVLDADTLKVGWRLGDMVDNYISAADQSQMWQQR